MAPLIIGFVGIGIMGASMARHLLEKGGDAEVLVVHTRTRSKAEPLLSHPRCAWADTPRQVAARCDVVFTMLGFPEDVEAAYFGPEGILAGARPGQVLVDHTSTAPALSRRIAEAAEALGAVAVDAPVSGGDVGARAGALSVFCGARDGASVVAAPPLGPLLARYGKSVAHLGPPGSGSHAKVVNQIVIASTMVGVCEALVYANAAGLRAEEVVDSISLGAAGCWTLSNLAPRVRAKKHLRERGCPRKGAALHGSFKACSSLPSAFLGLRRPTKALAAKIPPH